MRFEFFILIFLIVPVKWTERVGTRPQPMTSACMLKTIGRRTVFILTRPSSPDEEGEEEEERASPGTMKPALHRSRLGRPTGSASLQLTQQILKSSIQVPSLPRAGRVGDWAHRPDKSRRHQTEWETTGLVRETVGDTQCSNHHLGVTVNRGRYVPISRTFQSTDGPPPRDGRDNKASWGSPPPAMVS